MMNVRSFLTVAAVVAGGAGTSVAADHCNGPFCNQAAYPKYYSFAGHAHASLQGLFGPKDAPPPVYQAAPWYLYWPYDAHFLTPAPVTGAFYGPPTPGNFPVNPYFPGPGYSNGYGPMPGGPVPYGVTSPYTNYNPGYPPPGGGYPPPGGAYPLPGITPGVPGMPIAPGPIPPITPGTRPGVNPIPPVTPGVNPAPPVTPGVNPAPPVTPGVNPAPPVTPGKQ